MSLKAEAGRPGRSGAVISRDGPQTVTSTFRQWGMPDTGAVNVVDESSAQHVGTHAIRAESSRSQVAITFATTLAC